jgi:hypothetical protein
VAPERPPTAADAVNPSWSGYRWGNVDAEVSDALAAGIQPLLLVNNAPAWAEGPDRPKVSRKAPFGSWRPSAVDFGRFAQAAARRYPAVRHWQAWNEPNLSNYLTPQWRRTRHGFAAESPQIYRRMLNAFYAGVKRVSAANVVVTGGTAPFGDLHRGDPRMPPAEFTRVLLCVKGRAHPRAAAHCPAPVHFDALAHHPYPIGPPHRHAINADDVNIPDFGKLTRPLAVALRAGTVLPRRPKQVWATELSWDTSPPDPYGIPTRIQARYLEGAFYVLWRQGVDVALWFLMRDQAPDPSYASTLQSGIFLRGATLEQDRPKPSYTAFRFPFTAYRERGIVHAWGIAPRTGAVSIDVRRKQRWKLLTRLHAGRDRIFTRVLHVPDGTRLRARIGKDHSLPFSVFVPK